MRAVLVPLFTRPRAPEVNLARFAALLPTLAAGHPDLVILPECTFSGYLYEPADLERFAESIPGPLISRLADYARHLRSHVVFGMLERAPDGFYDSAVWLNRQGELLGVQRKLSEPPPFQKGETLVPFITELGTFHILICGDLYHEAARQQVLPTARGLLAPLARSFDGPSPDPDRWEREERAEYIAVAQQLRLPTLLVNALDEEGDDPAFGGAMAVLPDGHLLGEAPHGTDTLLWVEL